MIRSGHQTRALPREEEGERTRTPALDGWIGPWIAFAVLFGWHAWRAISTWVESPGPFLLLGCAASLALVAISKTHRVSPALGVLAVWMAVGWCAGARATHPVMFRGDTLLAQRLIDTTRSTYHAIEVTRTTAGSWRGSLLATLENGRWEVFDTPVPVEGAQSLPKGEWIVEAGFVPRLDHFPAMTAPVRLEIARSFRFLFGEGARPSGPAPPTFASRERRESYFEPSHWTDMRDRTRDRVVARWAEVFGPSVGAFAGWVLLGVRPEDSSVMREPFVRTGTAHLLAISGLHVGIVAGAVWAVLRILLGRPSLTRKVTALVLVLYAFLTGGGVSVLRSTAMFLLLAFGPAWGRLGRGWNALGWAAALLPLVWPELPLRPSYVLSVTATTGVLLGARASSAWMPKANRGLRTLVSSVCASMGAQAGTFALGLGFFSVVSWTGLAFNLVAIPLAGVVVPLLLLGGLVALLPTATTNAPVIVLARSLTETLLTLVEVSSRHALVTAGGMGVEAALLLSGLALCLLWATARSADIAVLRLPHRSRITALFLHRTTLGVLVLACGFVLPTLWARSARPRTDGVSATFLDVGQGDAVLLEVGDATWLFDCGPPYPRRLVRELLDRNITHLDRLFVTHGDQDHWGGYLALATSPVRVDTVSISAAGPWPDRFWDALVAEPPPGIPRARPVVERVGAGWTRSWGDLSVALLHPSPGFSADGRNDHSIALRVSHGKDGKLLLIGDMEEPGQVDLLEREDVRRLLPATVVQAGHHGSGTSLAAGWYESVSPRLVVASLASDNRYGFPHPDLLARLAGLGTPLLRTDLSGSVRVTWTPRGWKVRSDQPSTTLSLRNADVRTYGAPSFAGVRSLVAHGQ